MGNNYDPFSLLLETHNCDALFENEESADTTKSGEESTNLPPMLALESDEEELKKGSRLKLLTPNKILTRLLIRTIKAGNNSYKLKNKIRKILYILYQRNKIIKKVYNNLIKSL